ncbi:MAG TPA: hypothetical protein V6D18_00895 [Thermosynechococcaceae cyanobacterium]|jgi:hypothetical protein
MQGSSSLTIVLLGNRGKLKEITLDHFEQTQLQIKLQKVAYSSQNDISKWQRF